MGPLWPHARPTAIVDIRAPGFTGFFPLAAIFFSCYHGPTMGVPRHHMAKGKQLRRRSHQALAKRNLKACPQCGKAVLPHRVCAACGYYKGSEVINVLAKRMRKAEKKKQLAAQR